MECKFRKALWVKLNERIAHLENMVRNIGLNDTSKVNGFGVEIQDAGGGGDSQQTR